MYLELGKYSDAAKTGLRAVELNPQSAEAYSNFGLALVLIRA